MAKVSWGNPLRITALFSILILAFMTLIPSGSAVAVDEDGTSSQSSSSKNTATYSGQLAVVPAEISEGFEYPGSVSLITYDGEVFKVHEGSDHRYSPGQPATVTFERGKKGALNVIEIKATPVAQSINKSQVPRSKKMAHSIDVVYLSKSSSKNKMPKKQPIKDMVGRLSSFWKSQSGGQITEVKLGKLITKKVDYDFCAPIDSWNLWSYGAELTKRNIGKYYKNGRHLLVMMQASDCGPYTYGGVGDLGIDVHSGGPMWAFAGDDPKSWDGIVFHEFGHNTSLWHSDVMRCAAPHTDSKHIDVVWGNPWTTGDIAVPRRSSCWVQDYGDLYDVMGEPLSPHKTSSMRKVPALSATQKLLIGAIPESGIKRIAKKKAVVRKAKLYPISGNKGVRTIEITDPKTGEEYYLEYRSGTGRDKNTFYSKWAKHMGTPDYGPGVRVLRMPDNWHSLLLLRNADQKDIKQNPRYLTNNLQLPYLAKGTSFTSDSKSFVVRVTNIRDSHASIEVTFTDAKTNRISGANAVGASIAASKAAYPKKAKTVYLTSGLKVPDSFAAVAAASKGKGPVLITPQTPGKVNKALLNRIKELDPGRVVIVGSTKDIPTTVLNKFKKALPKAKFKRIRAVGEYGTSNAIFKYAYNKTKGQDLYIASGRNVSYAATTASAANAGGDPVMYVPGKAKKLDDETMALIRSVEPKRIIIAGGSGVVSNGIRAQLRKEFKVKRISAAGKYTTSVVVNDFAFKRLGMKTMYWSSGARLSDDISASVVASATKSPHFLVSPVCLPKRTFTTMLNQGTERVTLVGKTKQISNTVRDFYRCR